MTISSVSEFEAILVRVRMRIEKELVQRPSAHALEAARRIVEHAEPIARDAAKLKAYREQLLAAGQTLREEIDDPALADLTWDLIDFIDYRLS